jgi:bifunctional UDP-N-acetylglucosamine pyrophosphorylase / glucosamine-1-phosphate N-acetyltransferase
MSLGVIVLAAGKGTRMRSRLPKVAHEVAGKAMVAHVVDAAMPLNPRAVAVVVGFGAEAVIASLGNRRVTFVEQTELLGTADAVERCKDALAGCEHVMVLNGDSPLVTTGTLDYLREAAGDATLAFLSAYMDDPGRMGRVIRRKSGRVKEVVEADDYRGEPGPGEINTGQYLFEAAWLWSRLPRVKPSKKGERYLTALIDMAVEEKRVVEAYPGPLDEVLGVDDRLRLSAVEAQLRRLILERHMLAGVTIVDPASTSIGTGVVLARDVTIHPQTHLSGETSVGEGTVLGPGTVLRNARVGQDAVIQASFVEDSSIGDRVRIGPFAHVRGGAQIGNDVELGNYAEVKNSNIGAGVKMHHFSYMGDADIGENSNIAAGSITCNYDGVRKHRTTIGRDVFIGCDTLLVAPVTVGSEALTAAGAVVTKDVAAGERVAGVPAKALAPKRPAPEA